MDFSQKHSDVAMHDQVRIENFITNSTFLSGYSNGYSNAVMGTVMGTTAVVIPIWRRAKQVIRAADVIG